MNDHVAFRFQDAALHALPTGALHWPDQSLLVVSDLHLGKSARLSAVGGAQLPPYESRETLLRLETALGATGAQRVICLGDSFDAPHVEHALPEQDRLWLTRLMAGRDWTWIEGNHDPGPVALGGAHRAEMRLDGLAFRHIASTGQGEVSGHYHPRARLSVRGRMMSRPCFLLDESRLILPAFGAYTGGLCTRSDTLTRLMAPNATAILTGAKAAAIPMPRARAR